MKSTWGDALDILFFEISYIVRRSFEIQFFCKRMPCLCSGLFLYCCSPTMLLLLLFKHDMPSYISIPWQHTYKQALQHCKIIPKQSTVARNSLSAPNRSSSPNSFNLLGINENEVAWYVALLILFPLKTYFGSNKFECIHLGTGKVQGRILSLLTEWE